MNSLAAQWLGLCASRAAGTGWGTKISQAIPCSQKKKFKNETLEEYIGNCRTMDERIISKYFYIV